MKPYYQAQPQLRAPVGLNTLTVAMTAQGYNVVEETHSGSVYLMIVDR